MTQKTNWLTDAITETLDEVMELLEEVLEEDFALGILEIKIDQSEMRAKFEELAQEGNIDLYNTLHDQLIADWGQEEYDKQAQLYSERQAKE